MCDYTHICIPFQSDVFNITCRFHRIPVSIICINICPSLMIANGGAVSNMMGFTRNSKHTINKHKCTNESQSQRVCVTWLNDGFCANILV